MAAPSSTVWGSVSSNDKGKLGIYTSLSNTNTQTTVTIEVWFYSKWSVKDSANTFYFNNNATSATTSRGAVTINHTSDSSWNTANQTKIASYTYTYDRGTSAKTYSCAAKLATIEVLDENISVNYGLLTTASMTFS